MIRYEEYCLDFGPKQRSISENITYDTHVEELSFPAIYFGGDWEINDGIRVTSYKLYTCPIFIVVDMDMKTLHIYHK